MLPINRPVTVNFRMALVTDLGGVRIPAGSNVVVPLGVELAAGD
jgi:hypothetical protein